MPGRCELRLAVRTPYAGRALLAFLHAHLVPGVEVADLAGGTYARTLDLPHGPGSVELTLTDHPAEPATAFVPATFRLADVRDTAAAVERVRRLLDADADPVAVSDAFVGDPVLGPLRRRHPGLRVPGHPDGPELAVRAVIGQQVSLAAASTVGGRLVATHGRRVEAGVAGLTHLFPGAEALAVVDPEDLPMPRTRGRALVALATVLADGTLALDRSATRAHVRQTLLALPGIGPWTADVVAMRGLGDPDVFLPTDLGTRAVLSRLGQDPAEAAAIADRWRPWRSYAQLHLWHQVVGRDDHPSERI